MRYSKPTRSTSSAGRCPLWTASRTRSRSTTRGPDGIIRFPLENRSAVGQAVVSVKGGKRVEPAYVQQLIGAMGQRRAEMGVFICMTPPTPGMTKVAATSGSYEWPVTGTRYPRVQLLTIKELLDRKRPDMPTPFVPYVRLVASS